MPDLITHALVNAILPGRGLRRDEIGAFVFGSALPDLAGRAPGMVLSRLVEPQLPAGTVALDPVILGLNLFHVPVGATLLAVFVAAAWPERTRLGAQRWRLTGLLAGGSLVHLVLDLLQIHLQPAYRTLWPISLRPFEVGLYDAEISVLVWPFLLPIALWRWRARSS